MNEARLDFLVRCGLYYQFTKCFWVDVAFFCDASDGRRDGQTEDVTVAGTDKQRTDYDDETNDGTDGRTDRGRRRRRRRRQRRRDGHDGTDGHRTANDDGMDNGKEEMTEDDDGGGMETTGRADDMCIYVLVYIHTQFQIRYWDLYSNVKL